MCLSLILSTLIRNRLLSQSNARNAVQATSPARCVAAQLMTNYANPAGHIMIASWLNENQSIN